MERTAAQSEGALPAEAYQQLLAISMQLNTARDLAELLPYIIERAAELLGCEAASVLLLDEDAEVLRFAAVTGADIEQLARIPVPLEGSIAGRIVTENAAVAVEDVRQTTQHFDGVDEEAAFRTRSLLGVPMCIEGKPTGVLEALNKRSGAFTDRDAEVLTILASHAAIALRNARQMELVQEAYTTLREFDSFKANFLSIASHELRTPLSAILGILDILRDEVDAEMRGFTDDALAAGRRMHDVLQSMTQMELLRGGVVQTDRSPIVLHDVWQAAFKTIRREAASKGVEVVFDEEARTLRGVGDAEQIQQVATNILRNAVRFTDAGGNVRVQAQRRAGEVIVSVTDTGIGLAPLVLERIFDEFFQVEDYLTRTTEGLGLGLTIARKLIELNGGRIWATSPGIGHGTTVQVALPAV